MHMWPFVALMIMLALLVVATIVIAFPGSQPELKSSAAEKPEQGYAPKGWMQKAEREFH